MNILRVIELLLHYPNDMLIQNTDELQVLIHREQRLTSATRYGLENFVLNIRNTDLLHLQADYVALFDRGHALSLYLFEHVHGESRDRGQAMVELQAVYQQQGFDISVNELPDYIPLFLEFCSLLPDAEAQSWLCEVGHLLQLLHFRLEARNSPFAILFKALLELGGIAIADQPLRHKIQSEPRDDTPHALDQIWAEEPVIFGSAGGCGGGIVTDKGQAVPIDTSGLRHSRN